MVTFGSYMKYNRSKQRQGRRQSGSYRRGKRRQKGGRIRY